MAFFLIGRGPEGDLQSLSDGIFDSRQDAMSELSRLSADPSFTQWDTEVFVMDLEVGVPILLVRPHGGESAGVSVPPMSESAAGYGDAAATQADVPGPVSETLDAAVASEQQAGEPLTPEFNPVGVPEDAVSEGESPQVLRDALLRTTEQMTSEGIIAPESVGFDEETPEIPTEFPAEPAADMATEPEAEIATQPAAELAVESAADIVSEPEHGPAVEAAGEVVMEPAVETAPDIALEISEEVPTEAEPAPAQEPIVAEWPWNAQPDIYEESGPVTSPDIATVYQALEETQEAPVVDEFLEGQAADTDEESDSDFILDLDAIQPVSLEESEDATGEETPAPTAPSEATEQSAAEGDYSSPLTEYTCEDCVYVETCPNRDQRAPKDCGSFQWK